MKGSVVLLTLIVFLVLVDPGSTWRRRRRRCTKKNCVWRRGACSKSCGRGYYIFSKVRSNSCGGTCVKPRQTCYLRHCRVNCQMYSWGSWGRCSNTCGQYGVQVRYRRVRIAPRSGGARCPATKQIKRCRGPSEKCRWKYIGCSKSCGRGRNMYKLLSSNRCRLCKAPVGYCYGKKCVTTTSCPGTNWGRWGVCKIVRGRGVMTRSRMLKSSATCPKTCPKARQTKRCCPTRNCPVRWTACSRCVQRPYFSNRVLCGGVCKLPRQRRCPCCTRGDEKSVNFPSTDAELKETTAETDQEELSTADESTSEENVTELPDESELENVITEEDVLPIAADHSENDDIDEKVNVEEMQSDETTSEVNSDDTENSEVVNSDNTEEVIEDPENKESERTDENDVENSSADQADTLDAEDLENNNEDMKDEGNTEKEESLEKNSVKEATEDETAEVSDNSEVEGGGDGKQ